VLDVDQDIRWHMYPFPDALPRSAREGRAR
jgi:hypothetical protein